MKTSITSGTKNTCSSCHFAYFQKILQTEIGNELERITTGNTKSATRQKCWVGFQQFAGVFFPVRFSFRTHGRFFFLWLPEIKTTAWMKMQAKLNPPKQVFYFKKLLPLRFKSRWESRKKWKQLFVSSHQFVSEEKVMSCTEKTSFEKTNFEKQKHSFVGPRNFLRN